MNVISRHYEEYLELFGNMFPNGRDIVGETLLKTHRTIMCNGMKDIDFSDIEKKEQSYKNYFFLACKNNNFTDCKNSQRVNAYDNVPRNETYDESVDDKIKRNLLTDFKVISILEIVEDAFDEIDYRCFRLYHLLKGMTYKKLREITRIPNCKARVVKINKWLRDNVREQDIIRTFEDIYDE